MPDTYEQFLEKLRQTPRDWYVTASGCIRLRQSRPGIKLCPVEAVYGTFPSPEQHYEVVPAADFSMRHDPRVRADLLAACGLSDKGNDGGSP